MKKVYVVILIVTLVACSSSAEVSDENITNKTEVSIGLRIDGKVEILSGLNEGDQIVAEGLKKVRPRGKIKPIKK